MTKNRVHHRLTGNIWKSAAIVLSLLAASLIALSWHNPFIQEAAVSLASSDEKILFTSDRDGNREIYAMNADGTAQTRLTNNPANDRDPAFSPDGSRVAFESIRDFNIDIYVMNSDGTGQMRLTNNPATDAEPNWGKADSDGDGVPDSRDNCPTTPNPEKIVFASTRDGIFNSEIYVMNSDGTGQMRLTNNSAADLDPVFSPDGSKIAFASLRNGSFDIFLMNADGTGETRLTNSPANEMDPTFSPDGSKIAFTTVSITNMIANEEIFVMNTDGTGLTNLTNNQAHDSQPTFSPDGSKIAFTSDRDGLPNIEVYVMNADGSNQTNLTNNPNQDATPAFSPDGSKIAFVSDRDDSNFEIYVMSSAGMGQTRLTNNSASDFEPAFNPDGSRVAFHSNRDGDIEIFAMNSDGTNQTNLTNNLEADVGPSWGRQADSDGDGIGDACDNALPTITASIGLSRERGAPAALSQIATVNDAEDLEENLIVTVSSNGTSFAGSATKNGVSISTIAVDSSGNVTATVAADCAATNAAFTLKVTGSAGESATAMLTITVTPDVHPPKITCPPNITALITTPNTNCLAVNFPLPVATDNCSASVVCNPPPNTCFAVGTTTVTCTATDPSNNSAQCSFTVTVCKYDLCILDDATGKRLRFNSFTGEWEFLNPSKPGQAPVTGRGTVTKPFCKVVLSNSSGKTTAPSAAATANTCTFVATATVTINGVTHNLSDSDTRNSGCACP